MNTKETEKVIREKLFIVISNFNKNNPLAEKRTEFDGSWKEASEAVDKIRSENPNWHVGIKMPC